MAEQLHRTDGVDHVARSWSGPLHSNNRHRSRLAFSPHATVLTLCQSRHAPERYGASRRLLTTPEASLLGHAQERQAVFERFGSRYGRAAEAFQKRLQLGPRRRRGFALVIRNMDIGCDAYARSLRSLTPWMCDQEAHEAAVAAVRYYRGKRRAPKQSRRAALHLRSRAISRLGRLPVAAFLRCSGCSSRRNTVSRWLPAAGGSGPLHESDRVRQSVR
jgi:hypothetical protein